MAEHQIRFDDGAAYERMMGAWSRLAGGIFLDWIAPRPGLRWVDVGCGNGAFTELVVERMSAAATAPSPNWSSKGAHQARRRKSGIESRILAISGRSTFRNPHPASAR